MRDWFLDIDLTQEQAEHLDTLEALRVDSPIIWALVLSIQTSRSIARSICWPHESVLYQLREYKKQGLTYDTEGGASMLWFTTQDDLIELQSWVRSQRNLGGLFNPREEERD